MPYDLGVFVEEYFANNSGNPDYPELGNWQIVMDYTITAGQAGTPKLNSLMAFAIDPFP